MRNAYAARLKERRLLSETDLRAFAPSIFSSEPAANVSDRYVFVPTVEVIEQIAKAGFVPVQAGQSRARGEAGRLYTKHIVRFQHQDDVDSKVDLKPEILLTNSHNRSTAFGLQAGIFRFVCANGLVIMSKSYGTYSFRHQGDAAQKIVESVDAVAEIAAKAIEHAREMSKVPVTKVQQLMLARKAAALRYKDDDFALVEGLLVPKREEERDETNPDRPKLDLFTTINVVQENLMVGKIQRTLPSGRKSSTHAVNSVQADLAINRGIWKLAEEAAAELVAA